MIKKVLFFFFFFSGLLSGQDLSKIKDTKSDVYISGRIGVSTIFYNVKGINPRKPKFSYVLNGNPTLHIGQFRLPFGFLLSNYQRNFTQPFNQYGMSPKYKGVQFHLGYRNVRWSKYSLGGHRFFGIGGETQLGIIRLGFITGRFQEAFKSDSTQQSRAIRTSYKRTGYAAKFGIGKKNTYVDVIYFKAKDDILSLDSLEQIGLKPKENAVIGVKGLLTIQKKFKIKFDLGVSGFTRDSRINALEIDTTNKWVRFGQKILQPRISTQISMAKEVSLHYKSRAYGVNVIYKDIDPGYTSLGSYFLRTDIQQMSLGGYLSLYKNKYNISGKYGIEHDNVNDQKQKTTQRSIFSASLMLRPVNAFSFMAQYSNFGLSQNAQQISVSDTTRLENITKSLVLTPSLHFTMGGLQHNINIVYSDQALDDKNRYTVAYTKMKTKSYNISYSTSTKSGWNANISYNRNKTIITAGKTASNGLNLGLKKRFRKQHILIRASLSYNQNTFEEKSNGHTLRLTSGLIWRLGKNHDFRIDFYNLNNVSLNPEVSKSFIENNLRTTYSYRFTTKKIK